MWDSLTHTAKAISCFVGAQIGEWTLLEFFPADKAQGLRSRWRCVCSCGVEKTLAQHGLKHGSTMSCGHKKPAKGRTKL